MKIDLHTHSWWSKDGVSSVFDLLKIALKKGLDGIALTDHDTAKGWQEAREAEKKLNGLVILGQEIKTRDGDIIGLFLKKEISPLNNGKRKGPEEVIEEIKEQGGVVMIPHPFDFIEGFKKKLHFLKEKIDAFEVFNSRAIFENQKKAINFAKKNNLALVAGSDAHWSKTVGDAYTVVEGAKNLEDFKKGILERKTKIVGKKTPLYYFFVPTLARLGFRRK